MIDFILLSVFSYLLGSIVFGHIIAKFKKLDLSQIGSQSYTSTNVARVLGWRWGILSALFDFFKGVIPVFLALRFSFLPWQIVIIAVLPVLGHIFPVFFKFKGGKGGATFLGICLSLAGWKMFIGLILFWILLLLLTGRTSLTNLIFPWLVSAFWYCQKFPHYYPLIGIIEAVIISFALRDNIQRLIKGQEPRTKLKI